MKNSQYLESYLARNQERGQGKGLTIGSFLAYTLGGKAKQYLEEVCCIVAALLFLSLVFLTEIIYHLSLVRSVCSKRYYRWLNTIKHK
jgi:hypothetical protein